MESQAIDTADGSLRDEGVRVDPVDDLHHLAALASVDDDEEHALLGARVEAARLDDGAAAVGLLVHGVAHLLPFVGDDEELHARAHTVDDVIDRPRHHAERDIAVDDLFPGFEDEVAGGDHTEVAHQNDASQRDVAILIDDGGDHVRSSRRCVVLQGDAHRHAHDDASDHAGQESLAGKRDLSLEHLLEETDTEGEHRDGKDRSDAESPSEEFQGCDHQDAVDYGVGVGNRDARAPKQDGGDTSQATDRDLVGKQEGAPSQTSENH